MGDHISNPPVSTPMIDSKTINIILKENILKSTNENITFIFVK